MGAVAAELCIARPNILKTMPKTFAEQFIAVRIKRCRPPMTKVP